MADSDPDATFDVTCYYKDTNNGYGIASSTCHAYPPTACAAGKYNTIESTPEWQSWGATSYSTGVDGMNGRVCTDVGTGYYSAEGALTRTACTNTKPEHSSYSGSATTNACPWACDAGYTEYNNTCHGACSVLCTLHAGEYSYPLFADRVNVSSPVMHIKKNDTICYTYLEPDVGGEHGFKVRYNNTVYHAIDPR